MEKKDVKCVQRSTCFVAERMQQ